ncbi:MAG: CDP-alcohol phosphatidyltransferase family protein [Reyranella sp.]|uniref:CDP-alcohol phosphatidyltransferase family protein n=1 Tax=Reyranella sp. TaxID=1929291 RepID=UPI001214387D|nr:CDP-alcohol phosphatidyltransferase family protein [Reyranella sp.]TAJ41793.1 MAG: CDP-alcohol phosphatidyltransferase family protein [Reyranella sp.]
MFDPVLRRLIDPPLNRAGAWLAGQGLSANGTSLAGLAVGLLAVPALAHGRYDLALLAILLNRLIDGLDGPIARRGSPTAFGGYLDIMCDMAFYAAVPVGFALASPVNALWAAILLASFVCTGASFLGRAVLAAQLGEANDGQRGRKSFFHAAGLIEGSETIAAFVLFCLFPGAFPWLAGLFAALCVWTAAARVLEAYRPGPGIGS